MNSTSEFWKAFSAWTPTEIQEIEYRAYYNDSKILYTLSNPVNAEWPDGNWINITKQQYVEYHPIYNMVVDGKLVMKVPKDINSVQLEQDSDGEYISLKNNIIFVAEEGDRYKLKDRFVS